MTAPLLVAALCALVPVTVTALAVAFHRDTAGMDEYTDAGEAT